MSEKERMKTSQGIERLAGKAVREAHEISEEALERLAEKEAGWMRKYSQRIPEKKKVKPEWIELHAGLHQRVKFRMAAVDCLFAMGKDGTTGVQLRGDSDYFTVTESYDEVAALMMKDEGE